MSDLINRQQVIDVLEEQLDYLFTLNKKDNPTAKSKWYGINWARNTIAELPTAEPKVGKWEIEEMQSIYGKGYRLTCSECGDTFTVTENAFPYERYCRHCGAKMERSE